MQKALLKCFKKQFSGVKKFSADNAGLQCETPFTIYAQRIPVFILLSLQHLSAERFLLGFAALAILRSLRTNL